MEDKMSWSRILETDAETIRAVSQAYWDKKARQNNEM
jgi:hypothetical protein